MEPNKITVLETKECKVDLSDFIVAILEKFGDNCDEVRAARFLIHFYNNHQHRCNSSIDYCEFKDLQGYGD